MGHCRRSRSRLILLLHTVVTIAPVKKGEVFTKENIWVKRPGTGEILAKDYTKILGKKAVEDIAADTQLKNDMVE